MERGKEAMGLGPRVGFRSRAHQCALLGKGLGYQTGERHLAIHLASMDDFTRLSSFVLAITTCTEKQRMRNCPWPFYAS